jgi:hypothetical protein
MQVKLLVPFRPQLVQLLGIVEEWSDAARSAASSVW